MRLVVLSALGAALLTGCSGEDDPAPDDAAVERLGDAVTIGSADDGLLVASPQRSGGGSVVIDRVEMPKAGYVVVYADGGGAPGQRLGVSDLLAEGESTDVVVELASEVADGSRVHAMLHREDNENETLDFPDHDAPLSSGGGIVETSFVVTVS